MYSFSRSVFLQGICVFTLIAFGAGLGSGAQEMPLLEKPELITLAASGSQKEGVRVPEPFPAPEPSPPDGMRRKLRQHLLKSNFEKMKRDAEELVELAKALQEDLSKSNENVFSLKVVGQAEKIEKLAKRIKNSARGY